MTTPDLASICDEQEAEIGRLRADIADTLERAEAAEAEIGRLVLELAVVRRDWQSDVGTLTARAQTAEARAARLNTEVGYLLEENEEMGRREMQRAAAARKVAQFARKNMAAMQHVQRAQRERDAARAEAARLLEALKRIEHIDYGNGLVLCPRCGFRQLMGHGAGCELAAALRGPARSEQP